MAKYRIVSIDGGGIRGLITTILLQRIVATPGLEKFADTINLVPERQPEVCCHWNRLWN